MAAPAPLGPLLHAGARWALAAVLLYAGGAKILDPAGFVAAVGNYQLVPAAVAYGIGLLVPWLEIGCAAALLARPWRLGGWLLAFLLGAGFAVFVGSAWLRGLDIACGCFGGAAQAPVTAGAALRTLLYPAVAAAGFWYEPQRSAGKAAAAGLPP